MGQVPVNTPYGIVGDGRVARHFAHYFNLRKIPYRQWSRSSEAAGAPGFAQALGDCPVILVLISDHAIEPWILAAQAAGLDHRRFVHFSGALVSSLAAGAHPLMSFGKGFYTLEEYERIPFVLEKGRASFSDIFPMLPNPSFEIPTESKSLYHALCVMSGNFTVLLWQKLFSEFEAKLGMPSEIALPYLERIAANLRQDPKSALTGPLARGDQKTIQRNLDSLSGDRFQQVYQSFVDAYGEVRAT